MPTHPDSSPLACTLTAADHAARVAWIEELNATALLGYQRDGNRLRLGYRPAAAAEARELVRLERRCCPFLRFTTEQGRDEFVVTVDAPADLGNAADIVFAPYTTGVPR